jgi:hypothetical protein
LDSFKRLGNVRYMMAIQTYFCNVLNEDIESYRNLGPLEAAMKGDKFVISFHKKYAIANGRKTLENNLHEISAMIKRELIKRFASESDIDENHMLLRSAKTRIKNILFDSDIFDRSAAATIVYKIDEIMAIICADNIGVKNTRQEGVQYKALKLSMSDDFRPLD